MFALSVAACISPPPDYIEPDKVRPNLHVLDAKPPVNQIFVVQTGDTEFSMRIPIDYEPYIEPIRWQLWLNLDLEGAVLIRQKTLGDKDTEIAFDWKAPAGYAKGCQQISLLVGHDSSLSDEVGQGVNVIILDREDVAMASWWLNFDPEPGMEQSLEGCPTTPEVVGN